MLKNLLLFGFIVMGSCTLAASNSDSLCYTLNVGFTYHQGFLITHHPDMLHLQTGHIEAYELEVSKKMCGAKPWHQAYGYPNIGITAIYWDLANRETLGNAFSLIPFIDFHLAGKGPLQLSFKFGWGLSYLTKVFDPDDNYKDIAIGTRMNAAILLHPSLTYRISDRVLFKTGPSLSHKSNGSIVIPNLGINLATWRGSLSVGLGKKGYVDHSRSTTFNKQTWWMAFGSASTKQIYPPEGKNYMAFTLSIEKAYRVSQKSAWSFGADYFYDSSLNDRFEAKNIETSSKAEASRFGVHGGYEMIFDNFSFIVNMGGYFYNKIPGDGSFYHRIGMRYRVGKSLIALLHLKTHFGKADFVEFGAGYRFKQKEKVK